MLAVCTAQNVQTSKSAGAWVPPDATDEIILHYYVANGAADMYSACGGPELPPTPGIIIDDLRAE